MEGPKDFSMRCYALLCSIALAGCAAPRMIETGEVNVVPAHSLPNPTEADLAGGQRPHFIGPFDRLVVEVFGINELSRPVQVDASGHISLPLAGVIETRGMTPQQLADTVAERLRAAHVRDPRVTVNVTETVSQVVTVDGEVDVPGLYPITGRMTLMRAIARAQGANEFARTSHVVVFRTVDGQPMAALYDLRAIRLGAYQDPDLFPNDVVYVGESQARRLFPQILQAGGLIMTPLITALRR